MNRSTFLKLRKIFGLFFFLFLLFFTSINSSLFAQVSCHSPVDGTFYEYDTGALNIDTLKKNGLCHYFPIGTDTINVCYKFVYPFGGKVSFRSEVQYSAGGCNNTSCGVGFTTPYDRNPCLFSTNCNKSPVDIKTYNNSCGYMFDGHGVGGTCGFVSGNEYIVCYQVPLSPTCTTAVCPVIGCSVGNCGCPKALIVNAGSDQLVCGSISATLAANSAAPGKGIWSLVNGPNAPTFTNPNSENTTVTGLITGTYTFRWSMSCDSLKGTDDMVINVSGGSPLKVDTRLDSCKNGTGSVSVSVTGGALNYTYSWSSGASAVTSAISNSVSGLANSIYTVTVTDGNRCNALDTVLVNCVITEVEPDNMKRGFSIYPNPGEGKFTIGGEGIISITNVFSEEVLNFKTVSPKTEIDLSGNRNGIYFVQLIRDNKTIQTDKLIIAK